MRWLVLVASLACGGSSNKSFVYDDLSCGIAGDGGVASCADAGDGKSYQECTSDSQCPGSAPFCRTLGLYGGGDFNCNGSVVICRASDHDDCPR